MIYRLSRIYRYAFYRVYSWALDMHGPHDTPRQTATLLLSLSAFFVIGTIVLWGTALGIIPRIDQQIQMAMSIVLGIGLLFLHHIALVHNGRFDQIISEFENEQKAFNDGAGWYVFAYVVGPPSIGIVSTLIIAQLNS